MVHPAYIGLGLWALAVAKDRMDNKLQSDVEGEESNLGSGRSTRRRGRMIQGIHGMQAWHRDSMVEKLNAETNQAVREMTLAKQRAAAAIDIDKPMTEIDEPKSTILIPQKRLLVEQMKRQVVLKPQAVQKPRLVEKMKPEMMVKPTSQQQMVKLTAADFRHSDSRAQSLGSAFVKTRGVMGRLLGP